MNQSLDKEWYTIKETSEILEVNTEVIWRRIKNLKSSLRKIREADYRKEKGIYYVRRDYIKSCIDEEFNKEWYLISEASKLLSISVSSLRKRINIGDIPKAAYKIEDNLLIHKAYIEQQVELFTNLQENYYTYEEVSTILGKSINSIRGYVNRGFFNNVVKYGVKSYILKKDVNKYKEMTVDSIFTKLIQDELNLSKNQVLDLVKNEEMIIANNVNGVQYFIKRDSYIRFKEELKYTVEMASIYLDTTYEIASMLIKKKFVKSFNIKEIGLRTCESYLREYLKKELIPIEQLAMELDTKLSTLLGYVYKGELKTVKVNSQLFIPSDEAQRFKSSLSAIKMRYFGTNKAYEVFNEYIRFLRQNSTFKETIDLYEIWARKELEKSNKKDQKGKAMDLLYPLEHMLNNLIKELNLYTDIELKIFLETFQVGHLITLYPFLNFFQKKKDCNFSGVYVIKQPEIKETKPYTKEEWRNFALNVLDIEKHFEKAITNKKYAETWLWTLLHFSLDWRKEDLKVFKEIPLDIVGINEFGWFDTNIFTLEISQTILKHIQRTVKGVVASKNKKELVFVIPFLFEIPTALVFALCELHRRQSKKKEKKLVTSSINKKDLIKFFGEESPIFSNRKSSKSLSTYGWETAVIKGKGALAYWLTGFARSHKQKLNIPNPVTQIYIVTQNTDVSVEEMALHAFERGIFGWQVKVMIDALNNHEPLNLDEMTKAIAEINKYYTPFMIDSLSKYTVTRHEQSVLLLKELMSVPKEEIKQKLKEISKLQSPSLVEYSQCLVGLKNCPYIQELEYNLETPCLGCINRIDTNYILDIVNVELFTLIDRLKATPLSDKVSRIKYTHMIRTLTYILMDFRRAYDKFDSGYIRSFIDLDKLKCEFKELERTNFLFFDGEAIS